MDLTDNQVRAITNWAAEERVIEEVRLFGSRAKGYARPDSDVDLAVTADEGHYVALAAAWEERLTAQLGLEVRVRDFARNETIRAACEECNVIIFPPRLR